MRSCRPENSLSSWAHLTIAANTKATLKYTSVVPGDPGLIDRFGGSKVAKHGLGTADMAEFAQYVNAFAAALGGCNGRDPFSSGRSMSNHRNIFTAS